MAATATAVAAVTKSAATAGVSMACDARDAAGPDSACSSCGEPFDSNRKRRLVDACGHARCYSCVVSEEQCPSCRRLLRTTHHTADYATVSLLPPPPTPAAAQSQLMELLLQQQQQLQLQSTGRLSATASSEKVVRAMGVTISDRHASSKQFDPISTRQLPISAKSRLDSCAGSGTGAAASVLRQTSCGGTFFHAPTVPTTGSTRREGNRSLLSATSSSSSRWLPPDSGTDDGVISLMSAASSAGSRSTSTYSNLYGNGEDSDASSIASSASGRYRGYPHGRPTAGERHQSRPHSIGTVQASHLDDRCFDSSSDSPKAEDQRRSLRATPYLETSARSMVAPQKLPPAPVAQSMAVQSSVLELHDFAPLAAAWQFREPSSSFIGRHWVFEAIEAALLPAETSPTQTRIASGVVIFGGPGTGKTAIVRQLFEHSPLAESSDHSRAAQIETRVPASSVAAALASRALPYQSRKQRVLKADTTHRQYPDVAAGSLALDRIGLAVVACHLCHVDDSATCDAAEFVHSIASQMARSPRLAAYSNALACDSGLRKAVGSAACLRDAAAAFETGIILPLKSLRAQHLIDEGELIIIVDSVEDSEYHKPDCGGYTIGALITSVLPLCPSFMHFIVTVRSAVYDNVHALGFCPLCLDLPMPAVGSIMKSVASKAGYTNHDTPESIDMPLGYDGGSGSSARDIVEFFCQRVRCSSRLRSNMHTSDHQSADDACSASRLTSAVAGKQQIASSTTDSDIAACYRIPLLHLLNYSRGSFLFCKLVLELVEDGRLMLKEGNGGSTKGLPTDLAGLFHLITSLQFPSLRSFERVAPIISLCLASLSPLTATEMFQFVNAGYIKAFISWDDFQQRMLLLSASLRMTDSGHVCFIHSSWREWFTWRDEGQSIKFLCDPRTGHALIALGMARSPAPVVGEQVIELAHHILKAHVYKDTKLQPPTATSITGAAAVAPAVPPPRDLQAYWLVLGAADLTSGLVCARNLSTPNLKVSRLLLLCGASVTASATCGDGTCMPLLGCMASKGFTEFMAILLEYGAPIDACDSSGATALCHAAAAGQLNAVKMLCDHGATITEVGAGEQSPLVHAARHGHVEVVKFLGNTAKARMKISDDGATLRLAGELRAGLVTAAASGHLDCMDFLVDKIKQSGDSWEDVDRLSGETALTAACTSGEKAAVQLLLARGADPVRANGAGRAPLLCAARLGRWDIAVLLVHAGTGQRAVNGAGGGGGDGRGGGAGVAAAASGVAACDATVEPGSARTALMVAAAEGHGGVVEMLLTNGASVAKEDSEGLTAFGWACWRGHQHVAQSLIQWGADIEHADRSGRTPLDLAVAGGHRDVVQYLLEQGARMERGGVTASGGSCGGGGARSPLDSAAARGDTAVVRCFLRRGAKLGAGTWAAAERWPDVLQLLLEKLLADGSTLYKRNRIREAATRFQYALKRMPSAAVLQHAAEPPVESTASRDAAPAAAAASASATGAAPGCDRASWSAGARAAMRELQRTLMLNLSRCLRKLGELGDAVSAATAAVEMKPDSFDAYYARARARRDAQQYAEATADVDEALRLSPDNRELRRLLVRLRDECKQQALAQCSADGGSSLPLPGSRAGAWRRRPEETEL